MGIIENLGVGGQQLPAAAGGQGPSGVGFTPALKSGAAILPIAFVSSTAAPIVGQAGAIPFVIPAAGVTIDALVLEVTTAQASGLARVTLWNDDGTRYPGTVLRDIADADRVDTGTTGTKTIVLTSTLVLPPTAQDTIIWGAVITQGSPATAPTYRAAAGLCPIIASNPATAAATVSGYSKTGITGAAPSWVGTAVAATSSTPLLRLRVA